MGCSATSGSAAGWIREVRAGLPPFMQPSRLARVEEIPRDEGVGKVRRRLLDESKASEVVEL